MKFISDKTPAGKRTGTIGGKAKNLFILSDLGLPVPAFAVIPQEEGLSFIPEQLLAENNFPAIRECIVRYSFEENFIDELLAALPSCFFYAVRSSAADEDGANFSFAGQFESELYVTKETLAAAIRNVWTSAYSDRVQQYRETNGIQSNHGIAVIIQQMVDADFSGVGFGINPASGSRSEKVFSAVWGLGEGLVSGELNADNYFVKGETVRKELTVKTHQLVYNKTAGSGTIKTEVPEKMQRTAAMSDKWALYFSSVLDKLRAHYGKPQDIEFAVCGNEAFLLQARPVTTAGKIADPEGEYIVWDNSNIIESYPGLSSPLTFSFIRKMYEAVYVQFTAMMGVSKKQIEAHSETYANMLGLIDGRVYYNLLSWYKLLALLPGYSLNAGFMEKMMGVKEKFELPGFVPQTKFRERLRVANMLRLMLVQLRQLPSMRRSFSKDFEATMKRFDAIRFSGCNAWELMNLYREFEQTLLKKWKAPLVNDFFAMIYYGVLQKLVVKYDLDASGTLHNDLLCGARDIISTEPVHRCKKMATLINAEPEARSLFLENDERKTWQILCTGKFPAIKKEMDEYVQLWGDRTVGELKLETVTYRQQPELLVRVLKGFLAEEIASQKDFDLQLRAAAEIKVREKLKGKPFKKALFFYFLRKTRDLVSNRENLRFARTRGFGMVRRIFLAIGENFCSEGIIDETRDIFWLKKEEIFDFIQGTSESRNLRPLIALRKKEYETYEKQNTSERIPTKGIVYSGNDFSVKTAAAAWNSERKKMLKGTGCCPGRIKARVRVVHDPHSLSSLEGDILVTSSTDPGWVTLFPSASAILVERGSLLSHSAIVSREMGKPCIVGISNLLQLLKTGDVVEMDGATGELILLSNEE